MVLGWQQSTWAGKTVTKFNHPRHCAPSIKMTVLLVCYCHHEGKSVETYFAKQWLGLWLSSLLQYILIYLFLCPCVGGVHLMEVSSLLPSCVVWGWNSAPSGLAVGTTVRRYQPDAFCLKELVFLLHMNSSEGERAPLHCSSLLVGRHRNRSVPPRLWILRVFVTPVAQWAGPARARPVVLWRVANKMSDLRALPPAPSSLGITPQGAS